MLDDEPVGDTGLVAAAVTLLATPVPEPEPDPIALSAAVEATVTPSVPMPDKWDLYKVTALVTDMAQNLYEREFILKKHCLTEPQMHYLEGNEFYKRAYEDAVLAWQSTNSVQKRLALEAAVAIEANMPTLAARLGKGTEPLGEVVALLKVLSEIAGLTGAKAQANQAGGSQQFKIIFNINGEITEHKATPNLVAVQPQSEGEGTGQALSALIQASGGASTVRTNPAGA